MFENLLIRLDAQWRNQYLTHIMKRQVLNNHFLKKYIGIQITIVHSVSLFIQVQPRCLENLGYNSTNNLTVPDDWPKRGVM